MFGQIDLNLSLQIIVILLVSVTLHELAHALTATALGDSTPRQNGQLTLNPAAHMDQFAILFMVIAALVGFLFAYGRTFVNPQSLKWGPQRGGAIVAAAGPLTNLAIALVLAGVLKILLIVAPTGTAIGVFGGVHVSSSLFNVGFFLDLAIETNLILFLFNLIPIPPLDGFSIISGFLSTRQLYTLAPMVQYAPIIFLLFLFLSLQTNFFMNDIVNPVYSKTQVFAGAPIAPNCLYELHDGAFQKVMNVPNFYQC